MLWRADYLTRPMSALHYRSILYQSTVLKVYAAVSTVVENLSHCLPSSSERATKSFLFFILDCCHCLSTSIRNEQFPPILDHLDIKLSMPFRVARGCRLARSNSSLYEAGAELYTNSFHEPGFGWKAY